MRIKSIGVVLYGIRRDGDTGSQNRPQVGKHNIPLSREPWPASIPRERAAPGLPALQGVRGCWLKRHQHSLRWPSIVPAPFKLLHRIDKLFDLRGCLRILLQVSIPGRVSGRLGKRGNHGVTVIGFDVSYGTVRGLPLLLPVVVTSRIGIRSGPANTGLPVMA